MGGYCEVSDCYRPAAKGRRMCWCHLKRVQRQVPLFAQVQDRRRPWDVFVDAVIDFADSPDHDADEFNRRKVVLRAAAKAWVHAVEGTSGRDVA